VQVLIILGHPRNDSLCGAIAEAYADGARRAGAAVDLLRLGDLSFDPDYPAPGREDDPEDAALADARERVSRADHLVFVFPNWWGTMPARLKGFIDRIFKPGYAFRMHEDGSWDKLLTGKTAHLINTMDTPRWAYRWIFGRPGINAMKRATLQFCGVNPVRVTSFGTVFDSTPAQRSAWIESARGEGLRLARGVPDGGEKLLAKIVVWLRAMRLQFYPMTWLAYAVGAMAASGGGAVLREPLFWLGYAAIFLLEFATVLSNEHFDYPSDRDNRNFSPFNGGSRVLVDGSLGFTEVRWGIVLATLGFALCGAALYASAGISAIVLTALLGAAALLCLGYTVPPLKFSHRGLGEIDVAFTHSFLVLLFGYLLLGGNPGDGFPWLAAVPLFLSILPAILLSGLPDREADLAAGKQTLAVKQGPGRTVTLAMLAIAAAAATAILWDLTGLAGGAYAGSSYFIAAHALLLLHLLRRYRAGGEFGGRINGLMAVALSYVLWFTLVPFANVS
jgi:putative NADPH-quinone reductase/1,4-dihydroxy-2-naphthoate octaprenyltransferase